MIPIICVEYYIKNIKSGYRTVRIKGYKEFTKWITNKHKDIDIVNISEIS